MAQRDRFRGALRKSCGGRRTRKQESAVSRFGSCRRAAGGHHGAIRDDEAADVSPRSQIAPGGGDRSRAGAAPLQGDSCRIKKKSRAFNIRSGGCYRACHVDPRAGQWRTASGRGWRRTAVGAVSARSTHVAYRRDRTRGDIRNRFRAGCERGLNFTPQAAPGAILMWINALLPTLRLDTSAAQRRQERRSSVVKRHGPAWINRGDEPLCR